MLVLGRNLGDTIVINDNIFIKFCKSKGNDLKVAIDAPKDVKIIRGEVSDKKEEEFTRFAFLNKE